jgi:hypothetical protein
VSNQGIWWSSIPSKTTQRLEDPQNNLHKNSQKNVIDMKDLPLYTEKAKAQLRLQHT